MKKLLKISLTLFFFTGCASELELVTGLKEPAANEIIMILNTQDIKGTKSTVIVSNKQRFAVNVSSNKFQAALRLLVENKLPREMSSGFEQVYPPGAGGLIPTKAEEKARFLMAVQGEVENLIQILPGIVRARVAVVLPETEAIRDLSAPPPKASASVAVVYTPLPSGKPPLGSSGVKSLVSSAVEGLGPDEVTVVMTPNLPPRLIGELPKVHAKKAKVSSKTALDADSDDSALNAPHSVHSGASSADAAKLVALKKTAKRDELLIWLFAVLAVIGLLLGIVGIVRVMSLKSKLAAAQQGQSADEAPEKPAEIEPKSEG